MQELHVKSRHHPGETSVVKHQSRKGPIVVEHTCQPDMGCLVIIDLRRLSTDMGRPTSLRACSRPRDHAGVCRDQNDMVLSGKDYPLTRRDIRPDHCACCHELWPCATVESPLPT